jgi:hypothetical protein
MCLSKLNKLYRKPILKERTGYKVFNVSTPRGLVWFEYYDLTDEPCVPFDRWLQAAPTIPELALSHEIPTRRLLFNRYKSYPCGFHVFTNRLSAEAWMNSDQLIVPVRYDTILASGTQAGWKYTRRCDIDIAYRLYVASSDVAEAIALKSKE